MSSKPETSSTPGTQTIPKAERRKSIPESVKITLEFDLSSSVTLPCYRITPVRELILAAMLLIPAAKKTDEKLVLSYKSADGTCTDLDPERTLVSYGFDITGTELWLRKPSIVAPKKKEKDKEREKKERERRKSNSGVLKPKKDKPKLLRLLTSTIFSSSSGNSNSANSDTKALELFQLRSSHVICMSYIENWSRTNSPGVWDVMKLFTCNKGQEREVNDLANSIEKENKIPSSCTPAAAGTLLTSFLLHLPSPIFPRELYTQMIEGLTEICGANFKGKPKEFYENSKMKIATLLEKQLPLPNRLVAKRFLVFLRQLEANCQHSAPLSSSSPRNPSQMPSGMEGMPVRNTFLTLFQPYILVQNEQRVEPQTLELLASSLDFLPELLLFSPRLLPTLKAVSGEIVQATFDGVLCACSKTGEPVSYLDNDADNDEDPTLGELWFTNFRIIYRPSYASSIKDPASEIETLPVRGLMALSVENPTQMKLVFGDFSVYRITLPAVGTDNVTKIMESFQRLLRDTQKVPYATLNRELAINPADWSIYSIEKEMQRMNVPTDKWRITTVNASYGICPSYPSKVIVPASIDDAHLKKTAGHFNKRRFPILVWHSQNKSSLLCRTFLPASQEAAKIFEAISSYKLAIIADTGTAIAVQSQHIHEQVIPLELPKAAQMQEAFLTLLSQDFDFSQPNQNSLSPTSTSSQQSQQQQQQQQSQQQQQQQQLQQSSGNSNSTSMTSIPGTDRVRWITQPPFVSTWMTQIRAVIRATAGLLPLIKKYSLIIQHSSGDWVDTDSQVSSIVQLLADPYYRTIQGFMILIEKDWLSVGFPFELRSSINSDTTTNSSCSPVFLQFISAIFCIHNTFSTAFEFNEDFLFFLIESLYSGRFGTFLGNSELDRTSYKANTLAIWTYISHNMDSFRNNFYHPLNGFLEMNQMFEPFLWTEFLFRKHPVGIIAEKRLRQKIKALVTQMQKPCEVLTPADLLSLSANDMDLFFFPSFIFRELTNLTSLDLSSNNLTYISPEIGRLSALRKLDLSKNSFSIANSGFFSVISMHVTQLESLDLSDNLLATFPEALSGLTSLKTLNIARNKFTTFPLAIESLSCLEEFDISENTISTLPSKSMKWATTIKTLNLRKTSISQIPEQWTEFSSLTSLDLSYNAIFELPQQFTKLASLVSLKLSHNSFEEFPLTIISLEKLEELCLSHNQIGSLSGLLWQLQNLKCLKLRANKLEEIPICIGQLEALERLDLRENSIEQLRPTMCLLSKLQKLQIDTSKITFPPSEIAAQGKEAIFKFLQEQLKGNVPCYRIKFIIVGSENVGKTTLLKALRTKKRALASSHHQEIYNLSTDGVKIDDWSFNMQFEEKDEAGHVTALRKQDITLSVWDFAGQAVYGTTHQFFLSSHAAYVVAWNMEQPIEQSSLGHWLGTIRVRAPKAPVIIVGTHRDKLSSTSNAKAIIQQALDKFQPMFKGIPLYGFAVSCTTEEGLPKLREGIEAMLRGHPYIHQNVPGSFLVLEQLVVEERAKNLQPMVSWTTFKSLATSCSITEDEEVRRAAKFLSQIGTVVRLDEDSELCDFVVIHPQWLSDLFTTLITTKGNYASLNGILNTKNLLHLWKPPRFPPEIHQQLLAMLEKFEIVFNVSKRRSKDLINDPIELMVPTVLSDPRPTPDIDTHWPALSDSVQNCTRIYAFQQAIPPGFFPRLIVRLLSAGIAEPRVLWRHGLLLIKSGGEAIFVEEIADKSSIIASIRGKEISFTSRVIFDLMASLLDEQLRATVKIEIPCTHCIIEGLPEVHLFSIGECEDAIISGQQTLSCGAGEVFTNHLVPDLNMSDFDVPKVEFNEIAISSVLGKGAAAIVHKGVYNNQAVAVKQLKLDPGEIRGTGSKAFAEFRREAWIMSGLKHPAIVQLVGICMQPLCILTEFIPHGNLFDYINDKNKKLELPLILKIAHDVALGMAFLHGSSPPQLHRDLKSPNILLMGLSETDPVVAKVADFGLTGLAFTISLSVDNPIWLAPEVMQSEEPTTASDVYSFGIVLWEMLARVQFFHEISFMSLLESKVIAGERPPIPDCPEQYKSLIERCWSNDPNNRPTFETIAKELTELIKEKGPNVNMIEVPPRPFKKQAECTRILPRAPLRHSSSSKSKRLSVTPNEISLSSPASTKSKHKQSPSSGDIQLSSSDPQQQPPTSPKKAERPKTVNPSRFGLFGRSSKDSNNNSNNEPPKKPSRPENKDTATTPRKMPQPSEQSSSKKPVVARKHSADEIPPTTTNESQMERKHSSDAISDASKPSTLPPRKSSTTDVQNESNANPNPTRPPLRKTSSADKISPPPTELEISPPLPPTTQRKTSSADKLPGPTEQTKPIPPPRKTSTADQISPRPLPLSIPVIPPRKASSVNEGIPPPPITTAVSVTTRKQQASPPILPGRKASDSITPDITSPPILTPKSPNANQTAPRNQSPLIIPPALVLPGSQMSSTNIKPRQIPTPPPQQQAPHLMKPPPSLKLPSSSSQTITTVTPIQQQQQIDELKRRPNSVIQMNSSGASTESMTSNTKRMSGPPEQTTVAAAAADVSSVTQGGGMQIRLQGVVETDAPGSSTSSTTIICTFIVNGSILLGRSDGVVQAWNLKTNAMTKEFKAHEGSVLAIVALQNKVWTAGTDKKVCCFDLSSGKSIFSEKQSEGVTCLAVSGKRICGGASNGVIKVWDGSAHVPLATIKIQGQHSDVVSICFQDENCLWAADGKQISLVDVQKKTTIFQPKSLEGNIISLALVDGLLWSSSDDNKICVWNTTTSVPFFNIDVGMKIEHILGLPGGFAMTSKGNEARIWNSDGCGFVCEVQQFHFNPIISLGIIDESGPNSLIARVVSVSSDSVTALWVVTKTQSK